MLKLLIISTFFLLLTLPSCCFTVACDEPQPSFNLRFMRDGKNAVFGTDAFIPVDSIRFFKMGPSLVEIDFTEYPTDGFLKFPIYDERQYLVEIHGILADTITARLEEADNGGCCNGTNVFDVSRNGVVICEEGCQEEVTEIEI